MYPKIIQLTLSHGTKNKIFELGNIKHNKTNPAVKMFSYSMTNPNPPPTVFFYDPWDFM